MSYKTLRRALPFTIVVLLVGLLTAFLLRNVNNWDHPLSGEFLTSPFHSELLKRSIDVWDQNFGLGFANLLSSTGEAKYAAGGYSGAMWVVNNILNSLFQWTGAAYFFSQVFGILLLGAGVYWALIHFQSAYRKVITTALLTTAIVVVILTTDLLVSTVSSSAWFAAGHGLMLIAFIQYRRLSRFGFNKAYSIDCLIPLALSMAALLLVFSSYFLALALLIGFQGVVEYAWTVGKRNKIVTHYVKVLAISIVLMFLVYGYVLAPSFLSTGNNLISGSVGRHNSPMQYPLIDLLRFFNNPISDRFEWAGIWLQFGLVFLGIVLAMFSRRMRPWARIDLLSIVIFLFLAKGSAFPFPEVNHWLHVNIPFLRLMGSGYPYFGVVYTLFFYYLIYGVSRSLVIIRESLPRAGAYVGFSMVIIVLVAATFRSDAYLSGDFGGRVQSIEYPTEYYAFKKIAERDLRLGRAYYFPDKGARIGLDYKFSPVHPHRPMGCCYDLPFSSVFPIDTNWSNFTINAGYYGQTMAFLMNHFQGGDELARILSEADTRYAVFDLSLKKSSPAADRMLSIRDQVRASNLFEFMPTLSNQYIEVYENKRWHSAALVTQIITLGTDDPSIFLEVARGGAGILEGKMVVSSAITLSEALKLKRDNILRQVLLYNSDEMGLMLDWSRTNYEIKPDANSLNSDGQTSWYQYGRAYKIQDTEKYAGRFIGRYPVASFSNGARVNYFTNILPNIVNRLFVRAWVSPDSGMVLVHVNGDKRQLNLRSKGYVGLQWFDLGEVVDLTGKTKIVIEALDAGYHKRIDVVSLVPEKQVAASLEMTRKLLAEIHIERVEKPDYLKWKANKQQGGIDLSQSRVHHQINPKKLMVSNRNFSLNDDFDRFDRIAGQEVYNLIDLHDEKNTALSQAFKDRNFLRTFGGIHQRFIASADIELGIYSLGYELVACQAFSDLTLTLRTAYVTVASPIHIYVSDDALSWARAATRISDDEGNKILDLSSFAQGKKRIYLKISYEKLHKGSESINLLNLKINGVAGEEGMRCESLTTQVLKAKFNSQDSKTDEGRLFPKLKEGVVLPLRDASARMRGEHVVGPSVAILDKGFDPNWRMGDLSPFNIGYGFAAFSIADGGTTLSYHHDWKYKYRLLLYCSAGFYLFLWFALIWNSYRRERQRAVRRGSAKQEGGS